MSRSTPIPILSRSPSPLHNDLRLDLATRINGAHPDLYNSQSLMRAHAAMIGHFMGQFHAPASKVIREFGNDPSIIAPVFNRSCPLTPIPAVIVSLAPLMIPPISSPIRPNREPMTPTDPVPTYSRPPSYPPSPSAHSRTSAAGHIPSRPPSISSTSDDGQPLEAILAAIEVDQIAAAAAFIKAEEGPQPGIRPDAYWH